MQCQLHGLLQDICALFGQPVLAVHLGGCSLYSHTELSHSGGVTWQGVEQGLSVYN